MSRHAYEVGLSQVAAGLVDLCAPSPEKMEQLATDLRGFAQTAAQLNQPNVLATAQEAETAVRSLSMGSGEAHVLCARALFRLGESLLLGLLQCAETTTVLAQFRRPVERRILVVDDSRVSAVALSTAFVARNFMVRSVATMEEALAALNSFAPTILVSDIHMPKLDVGVLCRIFREVSQGRPSRIVLVSGTSGDELQTKLDEVRPDAFVSKMSGTATVVTRVLEIWDALTSPAAETRPIS